MSQDSLDPRVRGMPVIVVGDALDGPRMRFRPIPAGRFRMGSRGSEVDEEPERLVEVPSLDGSPDTPAFWIGETPVTQRQFACWTSTEDYAAWIDHGKAMVDDGKPHANYFKNELDRPAERVTWFEARAYGSWLERHWLSPENFASRLTLPKGRSLGADLPAEAHWEYASRAGTTTEYWSGDGEAALREVGWYAGNSEMRTHDVREKPANPWGLFDVHGNVWEWCLDQYDEAAYRTVIDGDSAGSSGAAEERDDREADRVLRGGSWDYSARLCRSALRDVGGPGNRSRFLGFRVCLLPGPAGKSGGRGAPSGVGVEPRA